MQFGTNVLGHHRLISLLLPVLLSSSARLVLLSSAGHTMAPSGGVDYGALRRGERQLDTWTEYGMSKWGDVALAKHVDWVYGPEARNPAGEIVAVAVHPGLVATNLFSHSSLWERSKSGIGLWLVKTFLVLPQHGAVNQIWAASVPDAQARALSGHYVVPYRRVGLARPDLLERDRVDKLWDWCEAQYARRA